MILWVNWTIGFCSSVIRGTISFLFVSVVIGAVFALLWGWHSNEINTQKAGCEKKLDEEKQKYDDLLKNKQRIEVAGEINVVSTELDKYIVEAKELIVDNYSYTNTDEYVKVKDFLWVKRAFEDKERITYTGEIGIGVNFENIKYDIDPNNKVILIKLPSLDVKSHDIDSDSFRADSVSDSIMVSSNSEDYEAYKHKVRISEEERAKENPNVLNKAKQHTEETFESFFKLSNILKDYKVSFVWEENTQEKQHDSMQNNPTPTCDPNINTCSTVVG